MKSEQFKKLVDDTLSLLADWGYEKGSVVYRNDSTEGVDIQITNIQQEEDEEGSGIHQIFIYPEEKEYLETPMVWIQCGDMAKFGLNLPAEPKVLCAVIHHSC